VNRLPVFLLLATLFSASILYANVQVARSSLASAEWTAPDFTLTTIDDEEFRLSHLRGTIVVLNFWATWCSPCVEEIPDFVQLQEEFGESVRFVGVSVSDTPEQVAEFRQRFGINYPLMLDEGKVEELYRIDILPTSFLIDRDGKVQVYAPGQVSADELRPILEDLLANRPIE
jgi:peroxiredoxin